MTEQLTNVVTIRITETMFNALNAIARRRGLRLTDIARNKLAELVEEGEAIHSLVDSPTPYSIEQVVDRG